MPDHRLAVVLLTNEGFRQLDGGVARYVRNILDERGNVLSRARRSGVAVRWHVAERAQCTGTDEELFRQSLAAYTGGDDPVRYHSMADPRAHGWEVDHFEHCIALGSAAGQVVINVAEESDSVLVVSGMSMFAMAARFVVRASDHLRIPISYVHMTHNPVLRADGDAELPETYADSVMGHLARHDPRVAIGWESHWMRRQYQRTYGIPDEKFLFARAGVPTDDPKFRRRPPDPGLLRSLGIPTDRDLVVSWGRGVPEKRFELLTDAARAAGHLLLPVILTPRPHIALQEHVRTTGAEAVLLDGQGDEVLSALCQWPRTRCAAFLSDREAASVTPVEAALMNGGAGLIVGAVRAGVYPELITDGETGLLAADDSVTAIASMLSTAASLDEATRKAMSDAAYRRAVEHHDFRTNWHRSFDELITHHQAVTGCPPFGPAPSPKETF